MIDKFNGCLLGLALGNALDISHNYLTLKLTQKRYEAESLSKSYIDEGWEPESLALSPDIQMSLAVAQICIDAGSTVNNLGYDHISEAVYQKYLEWLRIKEADFSGQAMIGMVPLGLALAGEDAFRLGVELAAASHIHPSKYIPAGFMAGLVAYILAGVTLRDALDLCRNQLMTYAGSQESLEMVDAAIHLSYGYENPDQVVNRLAKGRSDNEVLAVAVYCSLKYAFNFRQGVSAADSHCVPGSNTGSVTGAVLGALLGDEELPMDWILKLRNSFSISQTAMGMFQIFRNRRYSVYT